MTRVYARELGRSAGFEPAASPAVRAASAGCAARALRPGGDDDPAVGVLVVPIESAPAGLAVSPLAAIDTAATTTGYVGRGLGFAGPMGSSEPLSSFAKAVMIFLMWVGRLELVPIAVLVTRRYRRA